MTKEQLDQKQIKMYYSILDNPKTSEKYKGYVRGKLVNDFGFDSPNHPSEADRISGLGNERG